MRRAAGFALVALSLQLGCLDSSTGVGDASSGIRLVNLVLDPGQQPLYIILDGVPADTVPFLGSTTFSGGALYQKVVSGPHTFTMKWATDTSNVVGFYTFSVGQFEDRTVFATGGFSAVETADDNAPPPSGTVRLRVVNLSVNTGISDVFVTSPAADLAAVVPQASFVPINGKSLYFFLPNGSYRVRFVPAGTPAADRAAAVTLDIPPQTLSGGGWTIVSSDGPNNGLGTAGAFIRDH